MWSSEDQHHRWDEVTNIPRAGVSFHHRMWRWKLSPVGHHRRFLLRFNGVIFFGTFSSAVMRCVSNNPVNPNCLLQLKLFTIPLSCWRKWQPHSRPLSRNCLSGCLLTRFVHAVDTNVDVMCCSFPSCCYRMCPKHMIFKKPHNRELLWLYTSRSVVRSRSCVMSSLVLQGVLSSLRIHSILFSWVWSLDVCAESLRHNMWVPTRHERMQLVAWWEM